MNDAPPPPLDWRRTALFLDVDGTLAEFENVPGQVGPDPRRTEVLRWLCTRLGGRVAVLSGRTLNEVDRILEASIHQVAAVHGLVQRRAGKVTEAARTSDLDGARAAAKAYASRQPGVLVEDKGLSLALHYRLAPASEAEVQTLCLHLSKRHGLRLQPSAMVMELRAPGPDKGEALRRFMQSAEFAGASPVMVGDDLTDEPAFAAAEAAGGCGVLVGTPRATSARYRLPSVAAVLDWLAQT